MDQVDEDQEPGPAEAARALRGIGVCLERTGRFTEAEVSLQDAATRAEGLADTLELGRVRIQLGKIHLRRGDFKLTLGVTTLDRQPWEAIECMDHHFSRRSRALIPLRQHIDALSGIHSTGRRLVSIDGQ